MSGVWLASYVVLWMLVLVMGFLLAGALRQLGLIQLRLGDDPGALITDTGLERGRSPRTSRRSTPGPARASDALEPAEQAAHDRLHVPGCLSCRELVPGLNEVRATRGREFDFLVVCRGDVESCQSSRA